MCARRQGITDLKPFYLGKPIKCRITKADPKRRRLLLSAAQAGGNAAPAAVGDVDAFAPGMVVSGTVVKPARGTGEADDGVTVELETESGKKALAMLPVLHLSDHVSLCEKLAASLHVGIELERLLVVETSNFARKQGAYAALVCPPPHTHSRAPDACLTLHVRLRGLQASRASSCPPSRCCWTHRPTRCRRRWRK